MKEWKKVGYYAGGVFYACGDQRKIVIADGTVIYFNLDTQKIWWYRNTSDGKSIRVEIRIDK